MIPRPTHRTSLPTSTASRAAGALGKSRRYRLRFSLNVSEIRLAPILAGALRFIQVCRSWWQRRSRLAFEQGDTIVEVMIAMAILAVVLATTYSTSTRSLQSGLDSQYRQQALSYGQQQLELIKNADANGTTNIYKDTSKYPFGFCINSATLAPTDVDPNSHVCPVSGTIYSIVDKYDSNSGSPTGLSFVVSVQWDNSHGTTNSSDLTYKSFGSFIDTTDGFKPPSCITTPLSCPTQTPPPAPVITFNPASQTKGTGQTASFIWGATNAKSCTTSANWSAAAPALSGTYTTPTYTTAGTNTYTLTCTSLDGKTQVPGSTTVTVVAGPVITFNPTTQTISKNAKTSFTWNVVNAKGNCTASSSSGAPGSWSGSKPTSGTFPSTKFSKTGTFTYSLKCTAANGVSSTVGTTVIVK